MNCGNHDRLPAAFPLPPSDFLIAIWIIRTSPKLLKIKGGAWF